MFFGSDPVVPGPDQAGVKPLSDQIKVVFQKNPTSCFNVKRAQTAEERYEEEEEEATRPSDALRFTDCLSVTVSVSLPSSHHVLSLSLIITAASPRMLQ